MSYTVKKVLPFLTEGQRLRKQRKTLRSQVCNFRLK